MLCRVALRTQIIKQRINSEVQIKVLIEPMNNPLGVSPSKGNQGTTRGKEKKRSKYFFFTSCGCGVAKMFRDISPSVLNFYSK